MNRQGAYVFAGGATLALLGLYGIWAGWDVIQLERGWAQFIAGAVALSGGAIVMALARVIHALSEAADRMAPGALTAQDVEQEAAPSVREPKPSVREPAKIAEAPPSKPRASLWPRQPAPVEVDRYSMGQAEYVMFSDGSVEVRSAGRSQRYPSIAALRADAAAKRG